ncbi:MAG: phosphoribosylglycinamide formyltransferase [Alphaproteobacteria bacterium]|nr:phosphoribosylglycinamide formyltransferase [Alphaproteobacteria bacterium]
MSPKIRVAILISGRGSNMEKLIDATMQNDFPAQIVVVGSNNPEAFGLHYAQKKSIPTFTIDHKNFNSRYEFDKTLHQELLKHDIDLICLAGFMRILSPEFIQLYPNKIINIHPSLLPEFKGAHAVKDAIKTKAKISGCTTHFVTPEVDSGQIIMQSHVKIDEHDNLEILTKKILTEEHKIYPLTLKIIAQKILNKTI